VCVCGGGGLFVLNCSVSFPHSLVNNRGSVLVFLLCEHGGQKTGLWLCLLEHNVFIINTMLRQAVSSTDKYSSVILHANIWLQRNCDLGDLQGWRGKKTTQNTGKNPQSHHPPIPQFLTELVALLFVEFGLD